MKTNIIGERITELRENNGITLTDLANILGLQKSAMSYIENGSRLPKADLIIKMCDYFKVPSDYLLGLQDVVNNENLSMNEDLGLSEKSINVLKNYAGCLDGMLVSVINMLLEEVAQYPMPGDVYSSLDSYELSRISGSTMSDAASKEGSDALEKHLRELEEWSKGYYSTVISAIENYFNVDISNENDLEFEIRQSGALGRSEDLANWDWSGKQRWDDLYLAKKVKKNDLIEKVLIADIEEAIKKLNKNIKKTKNKESFILNIAPEDKAIVEWAFKFPKPQSKELPSDYKTINDELKKNGMGLGLIDDKYYFSHNDGFFVLDEGDLEALRNSKLDHIGEKGKEIARKHRIEREGR